MELTDCIHEMYWAFFLEFPWMQSHSFFHNQQLELMKSRLFGHWMYDYMCPSFSLEFVVNIHYTTFPSLMQPQNQMRQPYSFCGQNPNHLSVKWHYEHICCNRFNSHQTKMLTNAVFGGFINEFPVAA